MLIRTETCFPVNEFSLPPVQLYTAGKGNEIAFCDLSKPRKQSWQQSTVLIPMHFSPFIVFPPPPLSLLKEQSWKMVPIYVKCSEIAQIQAPSSFSLASWAACRKYWSRRPRGNILSINVDSHKHRSTLFRKYACSRDRNRYNILHVAGRRHSNFQSSRYPGKRWMYVPLAFSLCSSDSL